MPLRWRKTTTASSVILSGLVIFSLWNLASRAVLPAQQGYLPVQDVRPKCRDLPGADDVLVVMKTGATEFIDKFPIHLRTTLTCYPNYMVVSDHEELYQGVRVRDVLTTVSPEIQETHKDFELYRRLREGGRKALNQSELSGPESKVDGGGGKNDRPGWRLDKWKFLPMITLALNEYPDMKWYMIVETDTSLFWATLLEFTKQLNHTKPYYMGAQMWIGEVEFAHGGSGTLISNAALRLAVGEYMLHKKKWEEFTSGHWAGDCVMGKAFKDAGSPLKRTWPIIQGDHPGVFPFGELDNDKRPRWCSPTTTYHHLHTGLVGELWDFEQQWMSDGGLVREPNYLRYQDVFTDYVMPRMRAPKLHWDSKCTDVQESAQDENSCIEACEKDSSCLQYRFDLKAQKCATSKDPKLGEAAPQSDIRSGWMYDRIESWKNARPECFDPLWIT